MVMRFLFVCGVILLLFPLLKLPGAVKDWIAFGLGLYLAVGALYDGVWKKK